MNNIDDLYKQRKELLDNGHEWDSHEVSAIEKQIEDVEILPSFEEVLDMIASGRMKSIFA